MVKILHISDLHLGISLNEQSLHDDQAKMVEILVKIAVDNEVDTVIIAGDIFDRAISPPKALTLYDELVTQLIVVNKIPTIICAGNHDAPERLSLYKKMLSESDLFIEGKLQRDVRAINLNDCSFYLLPHFNLDTVISLFPEEEFESFSQAYKFVCDKIRSEMDKKQVNIIVAHCYVQGGILSESDRSAKLGGSQIVPAEVFDEFDYVALGHLHAPHNITPRIRYCGTPLKYSFGEKNSNKSATIFNSETKEIITVPILAERDLRELQGSYVELLSIAEKDKKRDDYIKIVMTDRFPTGDIYAIFKDIYPNLLRFEGMTSKSELTTSTLTANEIVKLTPQELLKDYYSNKTETELGIFELDWFEKALKIIHNGEELV